MRFGLDRMRRLMTALDSPQRTFASVHVVGTNGKSSTTRMIAAILEGHGLRSGAYLSPHLVSFTERVRVSNRDVSEADLAAAVQRAAHAAQLVDRTLTDPGDRVTQFEALTAAAYAELARRRVDVAVIEAGLGGRYDATNVLDAQVAVLTNVGLEHTRWLGPTVADIAREKLAVLAPGATLVVGADLDAGAEEPVAEAVAQRGARLLRADAQPAGAAAADVLAAGGAYQRRNFALACTAAQAFLDHAQRSWSVQAVQRAAADTRVPGRFDVLAGDPPTLLDGAHNPAGIQALVGSLPGWQRGRPLTAVVSVLDDKDAAGMLAALLPHCQRVIFTATTNARALPPGTLASLAGQLGAADRSEIEPDPTAALARARREAGGGVVLATGSIHLIADLLRDPGVRSSAS
jgi:dihydrofolate synthase/folylpolyglutamate synthase